MIQQLLAFIKEEQSKLTAENNAEDVASHLIDELLDPVIPDSGLIGMELMRYAGAYLLFEEQIDRDALVQVIKDL